MRRFFILASAAIVALASCAKTQVVYKGAPDQIAFKQITNVMTKADGDATATQISDLGVFANQGTDVYFPNTQFSGTGTLTNTGAFWPYEGKLDFTVYSPYKEGTTYEDNVLTMKDITPGEAPYYGVQRYVNTAKTDNAIPVLLNHVSSKIIVNLNPGNLYTVTSLVLENVNASNGTVEVDYSTTPATVTTQSATTDDITIALTDKDSNTDGLNLAPVYVLPSNQTYFTISFTQENGENDVNFTKEIHLEATWAAHHAYTYNITIANPNSITFTASVNDWTDGGTTELNQSNFQDVTPATPSNE